MLTTHPGIDRDEAVAWYRKNRQRTAMIFGLLTDEAYYAQPITLRHPIVFYDGHLPAFSLNTVVKRALGRRGVDERLERLFARGIDPDEARGHDGRGFVWPDRDQVRAFVDQADALVLDALATADLDQPGHPLLDGAEAVFTILEHEAMHQETLLYMWHRLAYALKRPPDGYQPVTIGPSRPNEPIEIPAGRAALGAERGAIRFGWDNEFGRLDVEVPAFRIDRLNVTNAEFLAFMEAGGYTRQELWSPDDWQWIAEHGVAHPAFWERDGGEWCWRGMFEPLPLPLQWPVYVSQAEASAYARWRGGRLPTEAEFHRAAYGDAPRESQMHPWGAAPADATRGVFDFASWDPRPAGTHAEGRSVFGVDDLVGNGWEWTSTPFAPFPGFRAMASYPEYSADFFDNAHVVMKGASPVTARELLRPSFRNWFRPRYPYVYATFRVVRDHDTRQP